MKQHTIRGWTDVGRVVVSAGCVPKANQAPPVVANPDLREIALPPEWHAMQDFRMSEGNTSHLPAFPPAVTTIMIEKNRLEELPPIPATVRHLRIRHNRLGSLPALPAALEYLDAAHNNLAAIPTPAPASLRRLYVTHNNIQSLPSLTHTQITGLGLGFNQLTSLPALPNTLRELGCVNNQITRIRNLPDILEVLACSNNPLTELKIDNLSRLRVLVANNCGLRHIPILPPPPGGDDDDNNNGGGGWWAENSRNYYFNGNPLTPEFAAIYQGYLDGTTNSQRFREEVLAEHRHILRETSGTLAAVQQVFKGPMREETGPNWYYGTQPSAAQTAMQGNFGPTNLIAQFLTGVPGTIERQRLDLLAQREALGNVPRGTTEAARERVVDALSGDDPTLSQRAKLYLRPGDRARVERAREERERENYGNAMRRMFDANNNGGNNGGNDNNNGGPPGAPGAAVVQVIDDNNNNDGEAMGIAMQQALAANAGANWDDDFNIVDAEDNIHGGRRKHRTPRNKKSKRQTRRH